MQLLGVFLMLAILVHPVLAGKTTYTYVFDRPQIVVENGQTAPLQLLLPPGEEALSITVRTAEAVILGDGYRIPHRQKPYPISEGPSGEPTPRNESVYNSDDPFPSERWGNLQTQFLSGHSIAFAALYPVSYRPESGQLAYYPWVEMTVESQPTLKAQTSHAQLLKRTRPVKERLAGLVQNPEAVSVYGPQSPMDPQGWDMLVITVEQYVDDYQEFVDYKNRSGILTTVETFEDICTAYPGVDPAEMMRNCIIDYYTNYGITYVFLCGDADYVAYRGLWSGDDYLPADLYFAGLDGNWNDDGDDRWGEPGEDDLIAEVFVGRSCADADFKIDHVINKTLMYQTQPVVSEAATGLTVGEDLGWNSWGWEYQEEVRLGSSSWGYTTAGFSASVATDTLYDRPGYSWSAYNDLLPMLNLGPNLVSHLGHANEYYVMKFNLGMINDYNFTNDGVNHNFFIGYSQGCYPGAFENNYPDCILEEFTNIAHGAVAFVGNSRYGWGDGNSTNGPSQHFNRQFVDAPFAEGITILGEMNQDSKEDNIWKIQGDNLIRFCYYELNLFGDPTLDVWTAEPGQFYPTYNGVAILGSQTFQVSTISVPGALVTVSMDGQVLGQAEANASGVAAVTFDQFLIQLGTLDLMITAHDMIPYMGTIEVVSSPGPYVVYNSSIIEDEVTGNGNGQLDYSEAVLMTMNVDNLGSGNAAGISLTISCDDPLMTITDSTEFLGNLNAGSTGTVAEAFALEIGPDVEDGHAFSFTLTATDGDSIWLSPFTIIGHAPVVTYEDLYIDDSAGNNDNHLDPGESADFQVTLANAGSCDAVDMTVVMNCDEPLVSIPQNTITSPVLTAGGQATLVFEDLLADAGVTQGDTVNFTLDVTAIGSYSVTHGFYVVVGDIRYAPLGPDAYGYSAYDLYDIPDAPSFDWFEIAPSAGGSGTDLELSGYQCVSLELPFTFSYYGVEYDSVNVSSDGWLSLGTPSVFPPMNFGIPHYTPPNNLLAAFWDATLDPSAGGQVCAYYDETAHRFVAEWYQVPHAGSPWATETFQIVLPDPAYYPTLTGDGEIVVYYHTVSSLVSTCTVGIEDADGLIGLQFLYNELYDQTAMPLENSFAIKYTTGSESTSNPAITMTPLNPPVTIPASGGSFDFNIALSNTEATPVTFDAWIMVQLPNASWYGPVLGPVNLTLNGGMSIDRDRVQDVPGAAPAGTYIYEGRVGIYPDEVINSDSFTFEKLSTGDGSFVGSWNNSGEEFSDWLTATEVEIPSEFSLFNAYPNPFNPATTISYALPQASLIKLNVYDLQGRLVAELVNGMRQAGYHDVTFEASNLSSGLYVYRLQTDNFTAVKKMLLVK
jgi:hypothetical protein